MRRLFLMVVMSAICAQTFAALTWTVGPEVMPNHIGFIQMHGSATLDGRIYVFGGNTGLGDYNRIYSATLGTGTVSSFTTCTALLPDAGQSAQYWCYFERKCPTYNGRIYIVGRNTNGTGSEVNQITIIKPQASGDVLDADINVITPTGTLTPRLEGAAVIDQATGRLYAIGGGASTQIDVAQISAVDGSVGAFTSAGTLPVGLQFQGAVIFGGRVYVIGGDTGAAVVTTVQHATINGDGTLGSWTSDTSLPEGRMDGMAFVYKSKIWYVGGTSARSTAGNTSTKKDAFLATVDGSGNITAWTNDSQMTIQSSQTSTLGYPDLTGPTTGLRRMTGIATDANGIFVPGGRIDGTTWTDFVFIGRDTTGVADWSVY